MATKYSIERWVERNLQLVYKKYMIESIKLNDDLGKLFIEKKDNENYSIKRKNRRNKIVNIIEHIQYFDKNNNCRLIPINDVILSKIKEKINNGENYSSLFVFIDEQFNDDNYTKQEKSKQEHEFTSTGIKFCEIRNRW